MHISCKNLAKKFGGKIAVSDISIDIIPGKILGLIGPNGAGKSTTIKMLTGSIKPSSGNIIIDNKSYSHFPNELKPKLGIMPQEILVWDDLNILENLEYSASIFKLDKKDTKYRVDYLINSLKLTPELKTLARNLSGGYRRRLNLAISIIHNPEVIFLDEPTPGIDAQSRILLTEFIQSLVHTGDHAVVLTDHYLEEAEKLSDYVVIIDNGCVVAEGTVPELKSKYGKGNLLQIHLDPNNIEDIDKISNIFKPQFEKFTILKETINIPVNDVSKNLKKAIEIIEKNSFKVLSINIKQPSLEDIFLILTGKSVRE
jgi:ABC-2 type transport system ATP-binding protein